MPVTPIQPQSPTDPMDAHFMLMPRSPSYELYEPSPTAPHALFRHAHSDEDDEDDDDDDVLDLDAVDTSSLAMITPPPPYDTPQLALASDSLGAVAAPPLPPPRRFRFGNRELFSMSPGTPKSNAITPTKLSAAAAAMFATPQMVQLNRKWAHLQRKRRRRNSSNGDSKELDKLVLQSVDWDENEMY
ncbi:GH11273 [Drosophila grimshawi]|uniref:GH11273 n=1 Tax=Drosophila grimshawi TaxID=7222 RepID=B4JDZ0_DROGR|nr:GH11273 [Drosophila grimshawi]